MICLFTNLPVSIAAKKNDNNNEHDSRDDEDEDEDDEDDDDDDDDDHTEDITVDSIDNTSHQRFQLGSWSFGSWPRHRAWDALQMWGGPETGIWHAKMAWFWMIWYTQFGKLGPIWGC